ncbi:M20 family metallopeptidase [Acidaminococcus massiliensis]
MDQKEKIADWVQDHKDELLQLSHEIHDHPELGFQEVQAARWQTELLKKYGFSVEIPFAGMDTAYKAVFPGKEKGPVIAILAEYDALPGVGHGCGHNIIATAAVGAGLALTQLMPELAGTLVVLGTPAEEGGGGKILMVERHVFDHIDYAMMIHPSTKNLICRGGLASTSFKAEYFGKAAHSSDPSTGVNALQGVINLFNAVDVSRQTWKSDARISGIITSGGKASNVIPDYAACEFTVRAQTISYLLKMVEDLKRLAKVSAEMIGATVKIGMDHAPYAERYPNHVMGETFKKNMARLGVEMQYPDPKVPVGSSDIGNVSMVVPAIHEYLAIADPSVNSHTVEFRDAAGSAKGDQAALLGAQGLAMTALDIFTDPALRQEIQKEFAASVPHQETAG